MSESMVERVEKRLREWCEHGCAYPQTCRCRKMAIAAIEAMREPTEEVYQAGREIAMGKPGTLDSVKERWKAMIDAALTPAKVDEAG